MRHSVQAAQVLMLRTYQPNFGAWSKRLEETCVVCWAAYRPAGESLFAELLKEARKYKEADVQAGGTLPPTSQNMLCNICTLQCVCCIFSCLSTDSRGLVLLVFCSREVKKQCGTLNSLFTIWMFIGKSLFQQMLWSRFHIYSTAFKCACHRILWAQTYACLVCLVQWNWWSLHYILQASWGPRRDGEATKEMFNLPTLPVPNGPAWIQSTSIFGWWKSSRSKGAPGGWASEIGCGQQLLPPRFFPPFAFSLPPNDP